MSDEHQDEAILVHAWHERLGCLGSLTFTEESWSCSRDTLCPMLQEVVRIVNERGENG